MSDPWQITLGSTRLSVIADPDHPDEDLDPAYLGTFVTQDSTLTLTRQDVPAQMNGFRKGSGFLRRQGPDDEGGLAWVENLISWSANGLMLSGKQTGGTNTTPAKTDVAVVDSRLFNGQRFCITSGGYAIIYANDDPSSVPSFSPALNAFGDATHSFHAGYVATAIEVFKNSTGVPCLFIATYSSAANTTKLYKYNAVTAAWTNTKEAGGAADFTGIRIDKLVAPVWWETASTGAGANRMLAACTSLSGGAPSATGFISNLIYQCIEGTDPLAEASWVAPLKLDPQAPVQRLLAFPEFGFAVTANGIWTFNDIRAMNLTPYATIGNSYTDGRTACLWKNGIAWARGFGLNYYDARQNYRRQDEPVEIGPNARFQDGIPVRGQINAVVPYENYLLMGMYDHYKQRQYVGRMNEDGVHFWAEQVLEKTASTGQQITHMVVSSPTSSSSTVLGNRTINLWMFTADEPFGAGSAWRMTYAPLPTGAGPLSLQAAAGTFTFCQTGTAYLTAQNWSDTQATKYLRRLDALRALSGKTLALYTSVTTSPTTLLDTASGLPWTLAISTSSDSLTLTPAAEVSGKEIMTKAILSTDAGGGPVTPILQAVDLRAKVSRETFKTLTLWVILERDHGLANGAADIRDPDTVLATIQAMQDGGRQNYRAEDYKPTGGTTYQVLVEQGERFRRERVGGMNGYQWRTLVELHLSLIG